MLGKRMSLKTWILFLFVAMAIANTVKAGEAHESHLLSPNSIKRYAFSVSTVDELKSEFQTRKLTLNGNLPAPAAGRTSRIDAMGPSGIQSHYVIERVSGRFHVYREFRRPQTPRYPVPYYEQEVVFDTPNPEVSPVGTLTYPASAGSFPAVVLIAGTGAHNRDAGVSLHKSLLVLADHLTRQGFAVLRYDKRGVGLTGGELHPASTTDDYASDVLAAVHFLQQQPNIDPARIGLIGHSEGGIIAPMVAAQAPNEVRFIVMLAGSGLPGIDVKSLQDEAARKADGMPALLIAANRKQERELYEIAASTSNHDDAMAHMKAATNALSAEVKAEVEIPEQGLPDEAFEALLTPWFRRFLVIDPRQYLERLKCPVLALIGEKDLQVPPKENMPEIVAALNRAGNTHATVLQLPRLNHFFQTAISGKADETLLIEETFAPSALQLISSWMKSAVR